MRLETFFEKFETLAEMPGAVGKLRDFILRFAFTGRLLNDGQARGGLPAGWQRRTIGSIAESITTGFACSKSNQVDGGHVHLRTHNISTRGTLNFDVIIRIDPRMVDPQKATVRAGDILFNNTNSQELVGKTSLVDRDYDYGFSNHLTRLRLQDGVALPSFVTYYLTLLRNSGHFARRCTRWINQAAINVETLKAEEVPLPDFVEQKRIVAKIDELMGMCDRLEAQQQERETRHTALARAALARFADAPTPANLQFLFHPSYTITPAELRKSILTLAVQGKLVPQDPGDGPAIDNLDEIESEKAALIEARKLRPNRVTEISQTKDLQYEVPDSWRWFRLGDVAFFQEGPGIRNWQFRTRGIKLLNVQNIIDGKLVLENTDRHISVEEFESTYRHFAVETGDILFASSGASWGKTAWFVDPGYTVMLNTSMVRLKFYSGRFSEAFLLLFLRTEFFRTQMETQLVGIQPNFGSTHLGRVYIPIPPLAEQRKIVAKVDELTVLLEKLENQQATSRRTGQALLKSAIGELSDFSAFR